MEEPKLNELKPIKKRTPEPDVEQQAFDEQKQLDPDKCANCGAKPEPGQLVPLCKECRDKLSRYPVPVLIIISIVVVLGLTGLAFTKFPEALKAGVAYSKGQKAEKAGKYAEATNFYLEAMDTYKDSTDLLARMGIASYNAGEIEAANLYLGKIAGRSVSKTLAAEVNAAIAGIDSYYEKLEAAKKAAIKKPVKKKKGAKR